MAGSNNGTQRPGNGTGSEKVGIPTTVTMYELFRLGMIPFQASKSCDIVGDIFDPPTSTGSGIYFENREVPLPSNCPKKRRRPTPLVDGKAMRPPPALYHESHLTKKRCISPITCALTCQGIDHQATKSIHDKLGFKEAALALTSLCADPGRRSQKAALSVMLQAPRLRKSPVVPMKASEQDI